MKQVGIVLALLLLAPPLFAAENASPSPGKYTVSAQTGIVYKTVGDVEIKLNLFLPVDEGRPLEGAPLLIDIVSGGWNSPGPGDGGFWRRIGAVERGFAVASVAHRSVTPECVFPAQIEDMKAAVRFLRAHAGEYGLDVNRFAAMGASSGGHMASMLGISDEYRQFDVGENLDQSSQVNAVIDLCCTADMAFYLERSPEQTPSPVYQVLGSAKRNDLPYAEQAAPLLDKARRYSPITYVNADFSPTLILQGVLDEAVVPSQSCLFYEALKRAKVKTELHLANDKGHTAEIFSDGEKARLIREFLGWDGGSAETKQNQSNLSE